MNFQQLEYALAVAQHKNFGRAAESCNVTQATLSAMIKKLEQELNVILFDRSKQPVITTENGDEVLAFAEKIITKRNELLNLQLASTTQIIGKIKLGIIPTVANTLLPLILPVLIQENPEIELVVSELSNEEIMAQLNQDKLDLGIVSSPIAGKELNETVLFYEPFLLYGKEKGKKYVSGKDLKNNKLWLLEEGSCFRSQSMTICNVSEKQLNNNNLHFESGSFETLLNLCDRFGGYTIVPELYYHQLSKKRRKLCKPFVKPTPVREISLVQARPLAKIQSAKILSNLIKDTVEAHLSTSHQKASELNSIAVN